MLLAPKSRKGSCTANCPLRKACPANIPNIKISAPKFGVAATSNQSKLELNSSSGYSNKSSLPQIHMTMVSRPLAFIGAAALILGVAVASSSIEHNDAADAGLRRRRLGATTSADRMMVRQVRACRVCIHVASGAGTGSTALLPAWCCFVNVIINIDSTLARDSHILYVPPLEYFAF